MMCNLCYSTVRVVYNEPTLYRLVYSVYYTLYIVPNVHCIISTARDAHIRTWCSIL